VARPEPRGGDHRGDDEPPFAGLLAAAQAGAPWAFERLYRGLAPAVAGYLRAQRGAEPDDTTSEVFERVFTHLGGFTGDEATFRSWVFTIAHHRLTDERRRLIRRPTPHHEVPERAAAGRDVDVEGEVLRRLATERVRRMCDRLAPDQRDVMLLRMVATLSIEETAEVLRKSPTAVKALQHRGVGALRRLVEREGVSL